MSIYIGIDLGTSGCRACAIDDDLNIIAMSAISLPSPIIEDQTVAQDAKVWWIAVESALKNLLKQINPAHVRSIAVDGTSGTILVTDAKGEPLAPALMYNDASCLPQAAEIKCVAPINSAAHGATSGLAKLLFLQAEFPKARHALHQADWIAAKLSGNYSISDSNNALKTGYDPIKNKWPDWLSKLKVKEHLLPSVVDPGHPIDSIDKKMAEHFKLPKTTSIISGTTDSIAAFLATGAEKPGEAVTSLGSTLAIKVITDKPVFSPENGVYSHKLGHHWLAGGASNCGGAVLKNFFTNDQINKMTPLINPEELIGLDYYPLTKPGERFPIYDPRLQPKLEPRPDDDIKFFQAILEGISSVEHFAYNKLHELGAPYPVSVMTTGGGSVNPGLTEIRKKMLKAPVITAKNTDACFGTAKLAHQVLD